MGALSATVERLARTYKPFGSVLSDAIGDHLRKVFGPSGRRPAAIAERVKKVWELGDGWAHHVTAEVSLGTREGASIRGGDLGGLVSGTLGDGAAVDAAIDAAVQAVAARRGVTVSLPSSGGGGGATVDAAALGEFTEQITGRDGVLATAARVVLEQLGLAEQASAPEATPDTLVDLVAAELGSDWPRLVAPGVRRPQGRADRRPLGQRPRGSGPAVAGRRRRLRRGPDPGLPRGGQGRCRTGELVAAARDERGPLGAGRTVRAHRRGRAEHPGGRRMVLGHRRDHRRE